jgi:predicted TIM-barrel fold metal-dependent hydrolase
MDEHEIAQAVVLPLVSPESSSYLITVDYVLAETKPHRDRLIPFCCVDPRTSYTGGRHGLRAMIRKWMDAGAKGFGEHKCGVPIDFAGSQEIYTVCGELKLPILFHLDEQRNTDVPGLPGLEKMLKTYKDTTFIGHGPGWWASLSGDVTAKELGGYPKSKIAPGGAMERLLEAYPNIHSDFSAGSGSGALTRDMEFAKGFITRRQNRLMFGTDYLAPGQQVPQFETFAKLDLPQDVRAKIFRDNARRLIGF